ncbi:MAG: gluconate 2-dehydrogenase subunit 3 family protein [Acidimicrobiales bacterium]
MSRARKTGTTPGSKGRYEGYDVLGQAKFWDETTAAVVLPRVGLAEEGDRERRFFTDSESETAGALLDQLLAQFEEPKVPVLCLVDRRLAAGETDGWRYEDLPEDADAWRGSLGFLDDDSKDQFGHRFHECSKEQQVELIQGIQDAETWHGWPAKHVWSLWTRYVCSAFYAHPWTWNEIGFGGPAYPRGYKVLHPGWREPWERAEQDADDPVPWARRAEEAKKEHERRVGEPETGSQS